MRVNRQACEMTGVDLGWLRHLEAEMKVAAEITIERESEGLYTTRIGLEVADSATQVLRQNGMRLLGSGLFRKVYTSDSEWVFKVEEPQLANGGRKFCDGGNTAEFFTYAMAQATGVEKYFNPTVALLDYGPALSIAVAPRVRPSYCTADAGTFMELSEVFSLRGWNSEGKGYTDLHSGNLFWRDIEQKLMGILDYGWFVRLTRVGRQRAQGRRLPLERVVA